MSEERKPSETTGTALAAPVTSIVNVATRTAPKPVEPKEPRLTMIDVLKTRNDQRALKDMLSMFGECRPHDTKSTLDFGIRWLKPLGAKIDGRGNWTLRIGDDSEVLWSSHIDTVDWREGTKKTTLNYSTGVLRLSDNDTNASCLGADCTTGVWIMREMALAKVPGLYIWHEAEEAGGQGSSWIAKNKPDLLKGMNAAIAFDRKGFDDIITDQAGGMCCSKEFAKALALQLPDTGFRPDPTGTFTDTANYTDTIPECTNLSIGYFSQHGKGETQNVIFAMLLRAAMLRFDESKLVIKRKPGEGKYTHTYYYGYGSMSNDWGWQDDDWGCKAYKEQPRSYILTGDTVRILKSAVGHGGALQADIGREGRVTQVKYSEPKTVSIKFPYGDTIDDLPEIHVIRVLPDYEQPYVAKIGAAKNIFVIGDRVRVKGIATSELLQRRLKMPLRGIIFKEGTVCGLGLRNDWIDVDMDSGQKLFSLKSEHLELIETAPMMEEPQPKRRRVTKPAHGKVAPINKPKDYSKTKCGGLCGGKCQGMCADPVKLKMLQRLAAKVDSSKRESEEALTEAATIRRMIAADTEPREGKACRNILDFVITYPDQVADLIEQWGMDVAYLYDNFPGCL